jgi:adenosine deaminase
MQPNDSSPNLSTEAECFRAWEIVTYSKAVFRNTDLLRSIEGLLPNSEHPHIAAFYSNGLTKAASETWCKSFSRGRFMQARHLHPLLTDDVLEKRLARTVKECSLEDDSGQLLPLLICLAKTFLCEGNDGSIRVYTRLLEPWQDLILVVPPMLITTVWMAERLNWCSPGGLDLHERDSTLTRIQHWLCDSTLPVDDDPFLDHLCRTQGLDETHMHLNGTTEAEKIWCDALARPHHVVGALTLKTLEREHGLHVTIGNGVDKLLRQEDFELSPSKLMSRIEDAIAIKSLLLHAALGGLSSYPLFDEHSSATGFLQNARDTCLRTISRTTTAIVNEAWVLVTIFSSFANRKAPDNLGPALLHYALIRSQFCRLLVQQRQNKGFDQFQYITLNELREATEQDYADRFRQLERGHQKPIDFVEGRFAPKSSPDKTAALIGRILRGYLQFLSEDHDGQRTCITGSLEYRSLPELIALIQEVERNQSDILHSTRRLRLGLVPHFIKQTTAHERHNFFSSQEVRPLCRDVKLRRETDQNARALVALLERTRGLEKIIRGIDAASNERHAGPEVFSPVFRRMRATGIRRFTFHVGEDFTHLASGLRSISEAIMYLDLEAGCRIGHGTAAGINPKKWWKSVQNFVALPSEERLDDLVFAWDTLMKARCNYGTITLIEAEIRSLAMRIWEDPKLTPDILVSAWKMRSIDPLAMESDPEDVDPHRRDEAQRFIQARNANPIAHAHYLRRHGVGADAMQLKRCQEEILVFRESDVLTPKILRTLQQALLKRLAECTIAIETLPSSNVRISIHESYNDHHASSWLGLTKRPMVDSISVVVGSDDPGIFATGLRQEYAHLLRVLRAKAKGASDPHHAQTLIQRLCQDSKRFRF